MSVEQQIRQTRAARNRRANRSIAGLVVGLVVLVVVLGSLPTGSPLVGLLSLANAAVGTAWSRYSNGRDALLRQQALIAFAVGAASGMAWTAWEAVAQAVDSSHVAHPGISLLVAGCAWSLAEVALDIRFAITTRRVSHER